MSNELYYIDENGKKQDSDLHDELLREGKYYDPVFHLEVMAIEMRHARERGDREYFNMMKDDYIKGIKEHNMKAEVDLTPF